MNIKPIAVGLLFGVGMALALKSWLLGIMFGIMLYVTLNEKENREFFFKRRRVAPHSLGFLFVG